MIYDLFSSSDYHYSNFQLMNLGVWFLGFIWFFWNINLFFSSLNRIGIFFSSLISWHYDNIKAACFNQIKGSYIIIGGTFFLILGCNMWGLIPYIFGLTTQMVLTFTASWILWLSIVYSSLEFSVINFFSNFTPSGAPNYLAPILAIIEIVSSIIRPLTLSLRLSINITTGHVFISLMGVSSNILLAVIILMWGYMLFEVGIGFIQGFVFSLLVSQYLGEHV
uniref:ATP synthase subunit a n=1 Tax=Prosthiostomum siphunculus TaxID=983679 RepID=A0A0P0CCE0_9PLAT|nr:ATP synthase F0 subunit 6 [Prosthiostomum siphunculus]ALI86954.1 ATP synthase F0 subunit 6 [Prosthiostomum siphunculus]